MFVSIAYLTVNLFLYYNKSIKNNGVPLYYDFKPNTIKYTFDPDIVNDDISEQFLSYGISYGVDVSEWQGNIDWQKVRATGISFAIIRCGFRQTHGSEVKEDANFKENIEGAIAAGLKVGVYFFGTAKNEAEAIEEAEFTVNLIKDYNLTYPVAYDTESFNTGRLEGVSYSTITDNVLTFTETVASYGYETMVYSYHNALTYILEMGKLEGKLIWLAHFTDKTNYKGNYNIWQYTSTGKVDGIKTNVDLNLSYFTYVDNEDDIVPNPNYVYAPEVAMAPVEDRVRTKRNSTIRTSPTTSIPNKLGTIPRGKVLYRKELGENFSLVEYEGKSVYVANDDIETYTP
ncbi:MAG TPA: hypothetical protein DCY94_02645 [Firmicutes bacterium]|nr:hypothetical protein [Bacillota bacterium]